MERKRLIKLFFVEMLKFCQLVRLKMLKDKNKKRRCAVRKSLKERRKKGFFHSLIPKIRLQDEESFINFHRMDPSTFDELLQIMGPSLKHQPNRVEEEITPAERLAITLRYLASGDSMKSIGFYGFRVGRATTSNIIRETCQLLWEKLQFVFPAPSEDMWTNIADVFFSEYGFPNCLGAIDGKHVVVQSTHSFALMGIADAHYKFIMVDITALVPYNDGSDFKKSEFVNNVLHHPEKVKIPKARRLPYTNDVAPFVFVADEDFPHDTNIIGPYSSRNNSTLSPEEEIFNANLSGAHSAIENAFELLVSHFKIYRKPIIASKKTVENIVKATVCLHNWLRDKTASENLRIHEYSMDTEQLLTNPNALQPIVWSQGNHASHVALENRKIFTKYFTHIYKNM